jgi:hypothetical protein
MSRPRIQPALAAPTGQQRPNIALERVDQYAMRAEHVTLRLRDGKPLLVDEQRFRVRGLNVHRRLDRRVDLPLHVVRLVDHERDVVGTALRDLAHDPEELERVDRADDQVVVGVLPVVEVKAAEQPLGEEQGDDLLDIRALRVVAGVDEHLCLGPEAAAHQSGRPPVRKVGRVEAGLEELVLDEQSHSRRQRRVQLFEAFEQAQVSAPKVVLSRVVRAVREPEADDRRTDLGGDADALTAVLERLCANTRVGVTDAAEPVDVLTEQVRIDRPDPYALLLSEARQSAEVVDRIPGNVQRDAGTAARQPVDERCVRDALLDGPRRSRPRVDVKART